MQFKWQFLKNIYNLCEFFNWANKCLYFLVDQQRQNILCKRGRKQQVHERQVCIKSLQYWLGGSFIADYLNLMHFSASA